MLTVIYCTRETNPEHKEHLIKSSGVDKNIQVIEIVNNGISLSKAYNKGLKQAKNNIVVFCHDDLIIETKQWGNKLLKLFNKNPDFGIIGVAGTKNLPISGKWWENPKKMYGRVSHTHEGKTWLSSYSDDLGQNLEEVVVCDGVWVAIDKTKIVKTFNETVEGFHFYDITFCFENYLEGVKTGVTTAIRINHNSIGMTNDQWEENRVIFAKTFKDKLPANIKRVLDKNKKIKLILASKNFNDNSLKSKFILDIAVALAKLGHFVSIVAPLGGSLDKMAFKNNIKMYSILEPPNFKLGDGKWQIKTPNGLVPSVEKNLYQIKHINYDIIHVFNDELLSHFDRIYSDVPLVQSIYTDGVYVIAENLLAKARIDMKEDDIFLNEPNFINKLLKIYNDVL